MRHQVHSSTSTPRIATAIAAARMIPRYLPTSTSHLWMGLLISVSMVRSSISSKIDLLVANNVTTSTKSRITSSVTDLYMIVSSPSVKNGSKPKMMTTAAQSATSSV